MQGYYHQIYAVPLTADSPLAKDFRWLKLREPRRGVYGHDMRWFPSQDRLLQLLHERYGDVLPHIPPVGEQVVHGQRLTFLSYIEGVTLDRLRGTRSGLRLADRYLQQIEDLFRGLASIDPETLVGYGHPPEEGCLECDLVPRPGTGGSTRFLRTLTHFTIVHAYQRGPGKELEELLDMVRVPPGRLDAFEQQHRELTDRPRKLLHGDLHSKNFVVDRAGRLWTIDWELALVGDPLYDLATHLHLMGYPADQEREVTDRWRRAVGPAASAGLAEDLPHYRAYKRVQSLCTDIVRAAARLKEATEPPGSQSGRARARGTAATVHRALAAAREPLGLSSVPDREHVESVFTDWWRRTRLAA